MRQRGFTLIEAMITVAILGISTLAITQGAAYTRSHATAILQRERALQVLEYEAGLRIRGESGDDATRRLLLDLLPEATYERRAEPGGETLVVSWISRGKRVKRELFLAGST